MLEADDGLYGRRVEPSPTTNLYIADLPENVDEALIVRVFENYGKVQQCKCMQGKYEGHFGAALVRFETLEQASWIVENLNGNIPQGLRRPIQARFAKDKKGKFGSFDMAFHGSSVEKAAPWHESRPGPYERPSPYGGLPAPPIAPTRAYGPSRGVPRVVQTIRGPRTAGTGGKGGGKGTCSSCDIQAFISGLLGVNLLPGVGRKPDEHCLYVKGLPYNTTDYDLYRIFATFGSIPLRGVKVNTREDGSCSGVGWVDFNEAASAQDAINALNGVELPDGVLLSVSTKKPKF